MANTLASNGYFASANILRQTGKSFGSGIVYKADDGSFYIITNRHVVGDAETVDITFESKEGQTRNYEGCIVLERTGNEDDIAIVELPGNFTVKETIQPHKDPIYEGDEVWTAGYPGLGNSPTWQFGKGIVSNASVKNSEFGEGLVIQHTSQVDAGNSGGPLLVKVSKKENGTDFTYEVIGINTWKAKNRENTNYSIPFERAELLINKVKSGKVSTKEDLQKAVSTFVEATKTLNAEKLANYVSTEMALKFCSNNFQQLVNKADEETNFLLRNSMPEEGLRRLMAICIINSYSKKKETFSVSNVKNNTGEVEFLYKNQTINSIWVKEDGKWVVDSIDVKDTKKTAKSIQSNNYPSGILRENICDNMIDFAYGVKINDGITKYYGLRWYKPYKYGYSVCGLYKLNIDVPEYETEDGISASLGIGGQIPFKLRNYFMDPYLGATMNYNVGFKEYIATFGIETGLKLGYILGNETIPYIEFGFIPKIIDMGGKKLNSSLFLLRMGWAF